MRLFDVLKNSHRENRDSTELYRLRDRLNRQSETFQARRDGVIARVMERALPGEESGGGEWRQIGDVVRERLARILLYERLYVL